MDMMVQVAAAIGAVALLMIFEELREIKNILQKKQG